MARTKTRKSTLKRVAEPVAATAGAVVKTVGEAIAGGAEAVRDVGATMFHAVTGTSSKPSKASGAKKRSARKVTPARSASSRSKVTESAPKSQTSTPKNKVKSKSTASKTSDSAMKAKHTNKAAGGSGSDTAQRKPKTTTGGRAPSKRSATASGKVR